MVPARFMQRRIPEEPTGPRSPDELNALIDERMKQLDQLIADCTVATENPKLKKVHQWFEGARKGLLIARDMLGGLRWP